ncbi:uncharacterized protein [Triticum aestivum]|uniref:uncharacterized protein n=1 Tax=Triticum aestivum TaxID=4565 RepID=UPI001D008FEB|nr:uncharacterized protein LOC123099400 [Triticum aestivum]
MRFQVKERGSANHSSRRNSKPPAERQPCRADIDGDAKDDEVGDLILLCETAKTEGDHAGGSCSWSWHNVCTSCQGFYRLWGWRPAIDYIDYYVERSKEKNRCKPISSLVGSFHSTCSILFFC